jgi:hypothetical protein
MKWSSGTPLALALGITVWSTRTASGQQSRQLEVGVMPAAHVSLPDSSPSGISLNLKTLLKSVAGSLSGGTVGFAVDQMYCEQHHGREPSFLFGPCFLYVGAGSSVGWFGGGIVGSTLEAARIAQKRGCPRNAALLRAFVGAAIGAAPGVSIVASRPGKYPPSRSVFIAAAPILAGLGAAAAVIGCHGT